MGTLARMWPAAHHAVLERGFTPVLVGGAAFLSGMIVAGGSLLSMAIFAAFGTAALVLSFAYLGPRVVWLWAPLSVITHPLNGFLPGDDQLVTFDRIWVTAMVGLLLALGRARRQAKASHALWLALCFLSAVVGVRTVLTPGEQPGDKLYMLRLWFDSLVLPLVLFEVVRRLVARDGRNAERAARSLMLAGALLAAIGVAEHFAGFTLTTLSESEARVEASQGIVRIAGPYAVPEVYGLSLLMCLAATLYWLLMRARSAAAVIATVGLVALEVLATFFTFFRVGWISAIVVVVATTGLRPRRYTQFVGTLILAIAAVGLAFSFLERVPAVSSRIGNTDNIAARIATYQQGLEIFSSAPVFGVGATRYTDVALTRPQVFVDGVGSVDSAHSSFIGILAEVGIIGAVALLAAVVAVWRLTAALRRRARERADQVLYGAIVGATTAYLLYSLTLTMLPYGSSNALMACLLGIVAGRISRTTVEPPLPEPRAIERYPKRAVATAA